MSIKLLSLAFLVDVTEEMETSCEIRQTFSNQVLKEVGSVISCLSCTDILLVDPLS